MACVFTLALASTRALAQSDPRAPTTTNVPRSTVTAYQEAVQLERRGDIDAALVAVDRHLAREPRDLRARFLRGVILTRKKDSAGALAVYRELATDHPELPEPFNNMAVIHAEAGRYAEAQHALEQALHANPLNATAQENLGDVHLQLAREAYERAMATEPQNRTLRAKLQSIAAIGARPNTPPSKPIAGETQ
jgi:Tfp pilus assembly protein PilF